MAILMPRREKILPLRVETAILAQVIDVANSKGIRTAGAGQELTRRAPEFVTAMTANNLGNFLTSALDDNELKLAKVPAANWPGGHAYIIVSAEQQSVDTVLELMYNENREHLYHSDKNPTQLAVPVSFDAMNDHLSGMLSDLAAFALMSRGFWIHW